MGAVAKLELLNLPGGCALDRTKDELPRQLELGEPRPTEFEHLFRCDLSFVAFLELDEDAGRLTPTFILNGYSGRV
jgi:hypothetical protein